MGKQRLTAVAEVSRLRKINIEIQYVVAQDAQMGDIDYHCNRTQYKNMRDVCARFLRVLHSI